MERKIGEIFECNGEWYQCIEQPKEYDDTVCNLCAMSKIGNCEIDECSGQYRADGKSVIFKKLKKLGEPYTCNYYGDSRMLMMQDYRYTYKPAIFTSDIPACDVGDSHYAIAIAIKQNKQDMEENKLNLKPFNLEAAKQGKPVCTRDGKPARIICFDKIGEYPIVALVMVKGKEVVYSYTNNGYYNSSETSCGDDLMMAPIKRKGWINLLQMGNHPTFTDGNIYSTEEEAQNKDYHDNVKRIKIIEIEWEEQP